MGGVENLANAIVVQAANDYRAALRNQYTDADIPPESVLSEVERFFHSAWYELLTKQDPDRLISLLKKEYNDGLLLIAEGNKALGEEIGKEYAFVCPLCHSDEATVIKTKNKYRTKTGVSIPLWNKYHCENCHTTENREVFE